MQQINLQVYPRGVNPIIQISQYDKGRQLQLNLYDGASKYNIPAGSEVLFEGQKPDGTIFSYEAAYTGNVVTISIAQQATLIPGRTTCELRILNGDSVNIGTINFTMYVEASPVNGDYPVSETDIPAIIDLGQQYAERAEDAAERAEADAALADEAATTAQNVLDLIPLDYINLSDDVELLSESVFKIIADSNLFEYGAISRDTGVNFDPTIPGTRIRTKTFLESSIVKILFSDTANFNLFLYAYQADGTFVGVWASDSFAPNQGATISDFSFDKSLNYKYKLVMQNVNGSEEIDLDSTEEISLLSDNIAVLIEKENSDRLNIAQNMSDIASIQSYLKNAKESSNLFEFGTISRTNGINIDATTPGTRIRTADFLDESALSFILNNASNYHLYLYAYQANGTFVGVWANGSFAPDQGATLSNFVFDKTLNYKYKLVMENSDSSTQIIIDASDNVVIYYDRILVIEEDLSGLNESESKNAADILAIQNKLKTSKTSSNLFEFGTISRTTGVGFDPETPGTRIRTADFLDDAALSFILNNATNLRLFLYAYQSNGTFVGVWANGSFAPDQGATLSNFVFDKTLNYKYKITMQKANGSSQIPLSDADNLVISYERLDLMDANLEALNNITNELGKNSICQFVKFSQYLIEDPARALSADGSVVFCGGFKGSMKAIDFSVESAPVLKWSYPIETTNNVNGIAFDDNYVYFVDRDKAAWTDRTPGASIGNLYILNKETGVLISKTELDGKACGIELYDHYVIIAEQVYGWAIYDISDPTSPSKVYDGILSTAGTNEFQHVFIKTINETPYVFITGFDRGLKVYDISTITSPVLSYNFDLREMNIAEYGHSEEQVMDLVFHGNYLYMTIAPKSEYYAQSGIRRGVISFNISDLSNITNNNFSYFPIGGDNPGTTGQTDTNPCTIILFNDIIAVNNGLLGLALFEIQSNHTLKYLINKNPYKNHCFRPMLYKNDGRIILGSERGNNTTDNLCIILRPVL